MGLEKDEQEQTSTETADRAAEAAAFESSFEGASATAQPASKPEATAAQPESEKTPEATKPADTKEATPEAASPKAADAAPPAPSPKADDPELRAEIRKLHGRIGSLNDQLQTVLKAKETEGKPAVLSTVQLTRLKEEYPEMAGILEGDIAEVIKGLASKAADPKEIENLVAKRVETEVFKLRQESITDRHETWFTDCWAVAPTQEQPGTRTPEYQAWINTMTKEEADAFENSQNPSFVNRKLDQFYDWKNKAAATAAAKAKAETEKQERLKGAITPEGTARASPQTMSEEEAERKAFEESFNS